MIREMMKAKARRRARENGRCPMEEGLYGSTAALAEESSAGAAASASGGDGNAAGPAAETATGAGGPTASPADSPSGPVERYLRSPLFRGISAPDCARMLACLGAREREVAKGETVLRRGDAVRFMGLVMDGRLIMERTDELGGRSILGAASAGDLFAESYAASGQPCGVDVVAATDCTLARFDVERVLCVCSNSCAFHTRLVRNLFAAVAERNIALTRKIADVSPRTIRGRLTSFLSEQAASAGVAGKTGEQASFTVPYSRQQLASYLCVDRSALSTELSKMRADGVVGFERDRFWFERGAATRG